MQGLPLLLKRIPKIIINSTGITYFRAHAIIDGVNYWSLEKILTVSAPPIIIVTSIPSRPIENSNYTIKWQVSGGLAGDVSKTELLWDFKKGNATVTDYSQSTPSMTGKTHMEFSQTLKAGQSSTIYFRAHAIVDGIEIFSDEKQITIYPAYETY
jgi:MarR-like DNA-binding transcriptional regulator SgrR of sgrS sRNA